MGIDYTIFEPHVFWGALVGAGVSFMVFLASGNLWLLLLLLIFVGIAVDVAAHNYQH